MLTSLRKFFLCFVFSAAACARLAAEPKRIVSMLPSNTEILFDLGVGDRVVGVTTFCDYPEEAKKKEKVGNFIHPNVEKIVALKPDLVLAGQWQSSPVVARLRRAGLLVVEIPLPSGVEEISESILAVARLVEREEEGHRIVERMLERVGKIEEQARLRKRQPKIYIEVDPPNWTVSEKSFINDAVTRCGAENIFAGLPVSGAQISWETVVARDPDAMLLFNVKKSAVARRPGWGKVAAVRDGRAIDDIPRDLLTRPTARIVLGMEALSERLSEMGFE